MTTYYHRRARPAFYNCIRRMAGAGRRKHPATTAAATSLPV